MPPQSRSGRPQAGRTAGWLAAVAYVAFLAAGCGDGTGLTALGGPAAVPGQDAPEIEAVTLPTETFPGAILEVEVLARGANDIVQVDIGLRDAVVRDTTILIDPPVPEITVSALFEMPTTVADSVLGVEVSATDEIGARSEVFVATIPVRADEVVPADAVP